MAKQEKSPKEKALKQKIRIRLKAYDPRVLDRSAEDIAEAAKRTGAVVSGPIPLPTKKEIYTVLRSPHVNRKSREQFQICTHKRVMDMTPTADTIGKLKILSLPAGVHINIKVS